MSISKEEYLADYKRLAPVVAVRGRVITEWGLGYATILDLDQDDGYGIGVRHDLLHNKSNHMQMVAANGVKVFADVVDSLFQLYCGVTWDGDLNSKAERDLLVKLGLAAQAGNGLNYITLKGICELGGHGYLTKDGKRDHYRKD